jgi:hypothetical protein
VGPRRRLRPQAAANVNPAPPVPAAPIFLGRRPAIMQAARRTAAPVALTASLAAGELRDRALVTADRHHPKCLHCVSGTVRVPLAREGAALANLCHPSRTAETASEKPGQIVVDCRRGYCLLSRALATLQTYDHPFAPRTIATILVRNTPRIVTITPSLISSGCNRSPSHSRKMAKASPQTAAISG